MVCAQHDAHLDEAGGVFGQLALEPQQADDVPHIVVSGDQRAHSHAVVGGLFSPVIADAADHGRWSAHLQCQGSPVSTMHPSKIAGW